jgi:hypothetical protein
MDAGYAFENVNLREGRKFTSLGLKKRTCSLEASLKLERLANS